MAMLLNSNQKLPFRLTITSSWGNISEEYTCENEEINHFSINKSESITAGIRLKEYMNFKVEFSSNLEKEAAKVIINKSRDDKEQIILYPGEEEILANDEFKWVPDEYLITVQIKDRKYYSSIIVDPKNMNEKQLVRMRKEINNLVKGVIYNLNSSKKDSLLLLQQSDLLKSEISLLDLLEDNFRILSNTLNDILKNPIKSLEKNYEIRHDSFKLDKKAVKWLGCNKSNSVNNSVDRPQALYQKKMKYVLNNDENKWLIKIIDHIRRKLRNIENKLKNECQIQNEIAYNEKNEISSIKVKLDEMEQNRNSYLFKDEIRKCKEKIYGKKSNLNGYNSYIELLNNYLIKTKKLMNQIAVIYDDQVYLHNSDFRKVKKPTKKLLKDIRYKYLYDFYQKLMQNKSKSSFQEKDYEYKETEKLYEYYILINIIKVMNDFEFKWSDDDSLQKRIRKNSAFNISSGEILNFHSNKRIIEVHYDEELDNITKSNSDNEIAFISDGKNLRPDFRIDIYDKKMNHIRSFIIEVKYRSFDKLYSEVTNTNVFNKLIDYKDKIKVLPSYDYAIDKVLVTYPEDIYYYQKLNKQRGGTFIFSQLSPSINNNGQFGYKEFKNEIKELIFK
jgi:hypothetical protein